MNAALHGIGQRIIHHAMPRHAGLAGKCGGHDRDTEMTAGGGAGVARVLRAVVGDA